MLFLRCTSLAQSSIDTPVVHYWILNRSFSEVTLNGNSAITMERVVGNGVIHIVTEVLFVEGGKIFFHGLLAWSIN